MEPNIATTKLIQALVKYDHTTVVKEVSTFIKEGADVNFSGADRSKHTPLHIIAGSTGDEAAKVVKLLLQAGANPNAIGGTGNTPLHRAALVGNGESVKALIHSGASVDARNARGETPLMCAAEVRDGSATAVKVLLAAGAAPDAKDMNGNSALKSAVSFENNEAIVAIAQVLADPASGREKAKNALIEASKQISQDKAFNAANGTDVPPASGVGLKQTTRVRE